MDLVEIAGVNWRNWLLAFALCWLSCLEFVEFWWWKRPGMVVVNGEADDGPFTELFTLPTSLVQEASCMMFG